MIKSHNEIKVWFEVQCRSCLQGCDSSDDSGRMILVDDVDNREFLCKLVEAMYSEYNDSKICCFCFL